ncbi:MAG: ATP-dependent DNA ligase, partial [Terriglobales bacterium]
WSQNDEHKTTVSVYSLRARERPTVSTPVKWEEVEQAFKKKDAKLLVFEADQVIKRVEKMGDLFEPVLTLKQKLPKLPGIEAAQPEVISTGIDLAAQAEEVRSPRRRTAAKRATAKKKARKV